MQAHPEERLAVWVDEFPCISECTLLGKEAALGLVFH